MTGALVILSVTRLVGYLTGSLELRGRLSDLRFVILHSVVINGEFIFLLQGERLLDLVKWD